ncbi:MAG: molybdenum cofactor biosynthesis protein MoaE [Planctomycetia bacterium]
MAAVWCALVREPIDTAALLDRVGHAAAGANVLFVGTTRAITGDVVTRSLDYEAHEPLAEAHLRDLADEAVRSFALTACAVVHRLGVVPVGEASVAVATSAPHRREAFAAAEWLMERIKQGVPIWKRDEAADGSRTWIHPEARPESPVSERGP